MAIADMIGLDHAACVRLDAGDDRVAVHRVVRIRHPVRLDHLQLGAVGVAGIASISTNDEHVAGFIGRAEHQRLQFFE
ncbi:hypothetical protein D3C87_1605110 [compost metagenome]